MDGVHTSMETQSGCKENAGESPHARTAVCCTSTVQVSQVYVPWGRASTRMYMLTYRMEKKKKELRVIVEDVCLHGCPGSWEDGKPLGWQPWTPPSLRGSDGLGGPGKGLGIGLFLLLFTRRPCRGFCLFRLIGLGSSSRPSCPNGCAERAVETCANQGYYEVGSRRGGRVSCPIPWGSACLLVCVVLRII